VLRYCKPSVGSATSNDGFTLVMGADRENDAYWDMVDVGGILIGVGYWEMWYWDFWNEDIVGGMPNDGVVPVWSMVPPGATPLDPLIHVMHGNETSLLAGFVLSTVNSVFSH
jgi:hypothetical protein